MNRVHGIISIRKDGSFGVLCSQCHHLISNKGEKQITVTYFICDSCHSINEVNNDLVSSYQNPTWGELFKTKEKTYIYYDKYGNPRREERK